MSASNRTLECAWATWHASPWFPLCAIIPRNDTEFDFAKESELDLAKAANVRAIHFDLDHVGNFVAWECGDPWQWWLWDKDGCPVLGIDEVDHCHRFCRTVRLVWTPQEWKELSGTAVCILDWGASIRRIFRDLEVDCGGDERLRRQYVKAWRGKRARPRTRHAGRS